MSTRTAAIIWISILVEFAAFEVYALLTDHRLTFSQTVQRLFQHGPWEFAIAFGALFTWLLLHFFSRLVNRKAKK